MYNSNDPSLFNLVEISTGIPLKLAAITFRAKPSLISFATSITEIFLLYSFLLPSFRVIEIIF